MRDLTPQELDEMAWDVSVSAIQAKTRAVLAMGLQRDDRFLQLVVQVRDASPFDLKQIDDLRAKVKEQRGDVFSIEFLIEHVEEAEVSPDRGFDWFYVQWPHITYLDEPEDTETPPPASGS